MFLLCATFGWLCQQAVSQSCTWLRAASLLCSTQPQPAKIYSGSDTRPGERRRRDTLRDQTVVRPRVAVEASCVPFVREVQDYGEKSNNNDGDSCDMAGVEVLLEVLQEHCILVGVQAENGVHVHVYSLRNHSSAEQQRQDSRPRRLHDGPMKKGGAARLPRFGRLRLACSSRESL